MDVDVYGDEEAAAAASSKWKDEKRQQQYSIKCYVYNLLIIRHEAVLFGTVKSL